MRKHFLEVPFSVRNVLENVDAHSDVEIRQALKELTGTEVPIIIARYFCLAARGGDVIMGGNGVSAFRLEEAPEVPAGTKRALRQAEYDVLINARGAEVYGTKVPVATYWDAETGAWQI